MRWPEQFIQHLHLPVLLASWMAHSRPADKLSPEVPIKMEPRPSVQLRQGNIIGSVSPVNQGPRILEQFLGIPYAQSTGGVNRFRPPIPVASSTKDVDASKYGTRCPAGPRDETPQGEDCLNLNLYRPKEREAKFKLPVLISIHGGAYNFGAGKDRQVENMVAWSVEPMIGISFNYRLGAFGFLPSKLTAKEGLLNLGLRDQRLLFEWVQENIGAFGGDPDNVTIMGGSAGAHSVCQAISVLQVAELALFL